MCPLCIATGTIAFASASSAGGLGAIAAKVLHVRRERAERRAKEAGQLAMRPTLTDRWRTSS